jgi:protein HOOK3
MVMLLIVIPFSLKLRIRALQRELASAKSHDSKGHHVSALETLLADANKARYRYQADYLEAHRGTLRLQAALEQIRSGKGVDTYVHDTAGKHAC